MNCFTTILARSFATVLSLALVNISIPMGGMTHFAPDPNAPKPAPAPQEPTPKQSRPLTAKESKTLQGRLGKNPYVSGQNKWDVVYQGINLMSGNFSTSGTDLTFEGGYGIPVNVTRSYSANNMDQGPLGEGWTLSVDVRNTAGGLLKSSGAPVRSVPVSFKERPAVQGDPRIPDANEPVEAVIATDAGGLEETIQKDADGILTTPTWDKNRNISEYETVTVGTALYQILKRNIVTTPEGTVYVYEKKGEYTGGGMVPWDDPMATPTPCNVLKIVSATDRHGNVTTYNYGTSDVSFTKSNGTVNEKPLLSIEMPNGHEIEFVWGNGTNAPTNRIRTATDGVRTVTYGYTSGLLTSVTTPTGKVTSFGYGSASTPTNPVQTGLSAGNLLTSMTDPRGLTTSIGYFVDETAILPYSVSKPAAKAYKISRPNGTATYVRYSGMTDVTDSWFYSNYGSMGYVPYATFVDVKGMGANDVIHSGSLQAYAYQNQPIFMVSMSGNEAVAGAFTEASSNFHKYYDVNSQNLLDEVTITGPGQVFGSLAAPRWFNDQSFYGKAIWATTTYNFMGNPLSKTVYEKNETSLNNVAAWTNVRTATVGYAYWGREKYYQQKAVKDQAGRASFNDYFDWNATQGKKGQTYRVYDEKRADFSNKTATDWRYTIVPSSSNAYSAEFDYDAKGRPTDVWKIQSTTTSPWTYVQTKTTYGSDGAPTWGAATQVVEDYGSGKINRTTNTLAYDSIGRAVEVQDASGKVFETNYDLDGVVQSVYRTDSSLNQMIVGYSYGTTPATLTFGMVTQVVDGLSGVTQDFTYETIGGGKGQVASVTESNGGNSYSSSYTYNGAGERETATYITPNGTTSYKYSDYVQVGNAASPSRVFQTMNKLTSGNPTAEEFHYHYDSSGRLLEAAFAQTPQSGGGAPTSAPYYTNSYPADTRARAYYTYDVGGRVTNVEHYWDDWSGSSYTSTPIIGNSATYELSGANRGLKTANSFYVNNSGSWSLQRTENYSYDADLDYLVEADYNDGLANENPTWSYDAAGNRIDASVVDNLNRATTIGGVSRTYDILGNTLTKGSSISYAWDALNRMTSFTNASGTVNYQYRADGMRTKKSKTGQTDWFYYDGQMPVETAEVGSSATTVTKNSLGARGIDRIERVGSSTTVGYPLYDGHGNMVATLGKSGSSFTVNDPRTYDAWGVIRSGNTTGDPKGRYVASLGHVDDDESGLTYMRARYYEPSSGRFVSEDIASDGKNWYIYCQNSPTNLVDQTGNSPTLVFHGLLFAVGALFGQIAGYSLMSMLFMHKDPNYKASIFAFTFSTAAADSLLAAAGLAKEPWANCSIKTLAFQIRLALMQEGAMAACKGPIGLGFFVGLLVGVVTAEIEYLIFKKGEE